MSGKIAELSDQIYKQKQEIIRKRLDENNLLHLLDQCETYKFKPINYKRLPDREEIWTNDGARAGMLLVTFFNPEIEQVGATNTIEMTLKYK